MKIKTEKKPSPKSDIIIIPFFEENAKKMTFPTSIKDFLKKLLSTKELTTKKGEMVFSYLEKKDLPRKIVLLSLGSVKKFKPVHARNLGGKVGRIVKSKKLQSCDFYLVPEAAEVLEEFLEGLIMVQYDVGKLKSKNEKKHLEKINVIYETKISSALLERITEITAATELVKDMVNYPSNIVDGNYLAAEAKRIAKENKYKLEVFGQKELTRMGWGLLLAVNQGAVNEPKCIVLEYQGAKDKREKPLVIIGKGVIFDTGGYNLKPTNNIETMNQDMAGGATVLGLFSLLKKLNVQKNVIGLIPIVENLVSDKAYRPSDIITSLSGKTVEITNTDAEGRLILADAITYGTRFKPEMILTIATLTGAVAVSVGNRYAGLMANNAKLRNRIQKAGGEVDDLAWPLPIHDDYRKKMDSEVADLKNYDLGSGRYAGSAKGAAFLEKFVEGHQWCHIDIGGTAFTEDPKEYQTKGATAHGLQMLLRFLENGA